MKKKTSPRKRVYRIYQFPGKNPVACLDNGNGNVKSIEITDEVRRMIVDNGEWLYMPYDKKHPLALRSWDLIGTAQQSYYTWSPAREPLHELEKNGYKLW